MSIAVVEKTSIDKQLFVQLIQKYKTQMADTENSPELLPACELLSVGHF